MADDRGTNAIGWFLAGLGLGALVGVLYAPRSGRETREAIRNSVDEGREFIANRGREVRENLGQWVERGKERVSREKDQISTAIEAGRQAYREAAEKKS
jgi:gas vesicle protein